MNLLFLWFVKLTGFPAEHFYFKKKVILESKENKPSKLKKGALLVSNHTSVYDYPLIMYTYLKRNIRVITAEVIYEEGYFMRTLIKRLGGIKVDRKSYDFSWMTTLINVLKKGHVGLIFPESRIPLEDEKDDLLEFKPSYVYCALESGVPIIPLYTNGVYGKLKKVKKSRAQIVIGDPINVNDLYSDEKSEKENIEFINNYVREKIKSLKELTKEGK